MAGPTPEEREEIVVQQYGGIVPYFEALYIESLIYAAGRSVNAFVRLDEALSVGRAEGDVVANAHEALAHAAAVSRFFWPARKTKISLARAGKLRLAFGLEQSSPLASRHLRDALEHFDERLDKFLLQDIVGCILPDPMVGDADLSEDRLGHIFRLVDPGREEFVLLGARHPFGLIRREIVAILSKAQAMSDGGGRLE